MKIKIELPRMWNNAEVNDHFFIILSFSSCIAKKNYLSFQKRYKRTLEILFVEFNILGFRYSFSFIIAKRRKLTEEDLSQLLDKL